MTYNQILTKIEFYENKIIKNIKNNNGKSQNYAKQKFDFYFKKLSVDFPENIQATALQYMLYTDENKKVEATIIGIAKKYY